MYGCLPYIMVIELENLLNPSTGPGSCIGGHCTKATPRLDDPKCFAPQFVFNLETLPLCVCHQRRIIAVTPGPGDRGRKGVRGLMSVTGPQSSHPTSNT